MYYAITDNEGQTLDSFDNEADARHALLAMVEDDPRFAEEGILIVHADDGVPLETLDWHDLQTEVVEQRASISVFISIARYPAPTSAVGKGGATIPLPSFLWSVPVAS